MRGHTLILIDDGIATGATMLAAAKALRQEEPKEIIVAVPVAARDTGYKFRSKANHVVCAAMPEPFVAVGSWYEEGRSLWTLRTTCGRWIPPFLLDMMKWSF